MTDIQQPAAPEAAGSGDVHGWLFELKALLTLGWPLVVAQLAQSALLTTDVILLGWLGPRHLAAGALAHALLICVQLLGVGVATAVAPLVAQALGSGNRRAVRRIVQQGLWIAIILVVLLVPIVWNIRPIYIAIGQDPELSAMAETFVHYACWMFVPAFMIIVLRSFLSAHGATAAILVITVAGVGVNFVLGYGLIFGNFGLPRMEMAGAGLATSLVNLFMLALMFAYVLTRRRYRRYHLLARFLDPDWPTFWRIWRVGLPIGLLLLAEVGLFSAAALLQGWLGEDEVAAHAVALQFASIAFMVPLGLSQATTVRVGRAVGAGSIEGVRKAGWTSLGLTLVFMTCSMLVYLSFPHQLVSLFLDPALAENGKPLALAASFMLVAALFQLGDGTQVTMAAALRGLNDTTAPLIIALVGYWGVGFPVAYVLGFQLGWRGIGIWWGLAAGLFFVAIVLVGRFALRDRFGLMGRARRHG